MTIIENSYIYSKDSGSPQNGNIFRHNPINEQKAQLSFPLLSADLRVSGSMKALAVITCHQNHQDWPFMDNYLIVMEVEPNILSSNDSWTRENEEPLPI